MWVQRTLTVASVCTAALLISVDRNGTEAFERDAPPASSVEGGPEVVKPPTDRRWVERDGSHFAVSPEKVRDLTTRRKWRAFMGAPPVIPHLLEKLDICGNCHDEGASQRDGIAGKRPHANLVNCTQCHVEAVSERFGEAVDSPNSFQGHPEPIGGPRAFIGAPPAIPHPTAMRTKCLGCHGQFGLPAIRTPHPERANCRQCHATIAAINLKH